MEKLIYLKDVVTLEFAEDKCVGCGMCTVVCPHGVFGMDTDRVRIENRDACMECGACAKNCPTDAIYVNPDDGCGCAAYIIGSWIARFRGKTSSKCGC
jgi:NAD-dependent dihydropyrimidine dehydrogenase PreA subunit